MTEKESKENMVVCVCRDLGLSAFIKMSGYQLKAKKGKDFEFYVKESEQEQFEQCKIEYVNSAFAEFDSELMLLKKI
jgi:hypothetical protein